MFKCGFRNESKFLVTGIFAYLEPVVGSNRVNDKMTVSGYTNLLQELLFSLAGFSGDVFEEEDAE